MHHLLSSSPGLLVLLALASLSCTPNRPSTQPSGKAIGPMPPSYNGRALAVVTSAPATNPADPFASATLLALADPRSGKSSPLTTEARVYSTSSALHIRIQCAEPQMDQLVTDAREMWMRDEVEVFIEPAADTILRPYHQIMMDAAGRTVFDRGHIYRRYFNDKAIAEPWNPKIDARVIKAKDAWTAELHIPFDQLKGPAASAPLWRLNICRVRPGKPDASSPDKPVKEFSASWAKLDSNSFQWPARFGYLLFAARATPALLEQIRSAPIPVDKSADAVNEPALPGMIDEFWDELTVPATAEKAETALKNFYVLGPAMQKLVDERLAAAMERHRASGDRAGGLLLREYEYRIQQWPPDEDPPAQETLDRLAAWEPRQIKDNDGHMMYYRLMKPAHYDPAKKYPLVIELHGGREQGTDNRYQLEGGVWAFTEPAVREKYPCFVLAPQCPPGVPWADTRSNPASLDVMKATSNYRLADQPNSTARMLIDVIESLPKEFTSIDPGRIYITGSSMGGFGTWELLARRPNLFAAAIPICGGGDETKAATFAHVPVWIFHGEKDDRVKVQASRNMTAALKAAGGHPIYTEIPGAGHNNGAKVTSDEVMTWMFKQRRAE